ncbi:protein kinase [Nocardiopsis alba]|uniref:protein kinase domain-containing protein n=1 Tax=Nocardiopsis alba TaxID=53437 RepID=UPI00366BE4A7
MHPSAAEDPRTIGPYRIVTHLGSGGMGHVYLGLDIENRPAAIKMVRPEYVYEPGFRERFAREVHQARGVSGSGLPRILDADTTGPSPWLATDFFLGPSLRDLVGRVGPLPEPTVRRLGGSIAGSLAHLHSTGVVHRDLKPGNVLITTDGPRVIDLGISRPIGDAPDGDEEEFAGTPGYMAPETIRGEATGPAADVFALGALLVFSLTGDGPFGDGHPSSVLYRIEHGSPDLNGVPASLRGLLAACLDKDPGRRPTIGHILRVFGEPSPSTVRSWLPQTAVAVLDGYEHEHRAALHAFHESGLHPEQERERPRRRTLVLAGITALSLAAGLGAWAVGGPFGPGGEAPAPAPREEAFGSDRADCDPGVHPADEYVDSIDPEPTLGEGAVSVRFSADGSVLAVHLKSGVVALWDWERRVSLAEIPLEGDAPFREIEFSPNGCLIAHGSESGAHVYSLETGEHTVHLEGRNVRSVAFSPDGTTLAMTDRTFEDLNGGVYTVDLATGEDITRFVTRTRMALGGVAYSPKGTWLAAQDGTGALRVWDTESGEEIRGVTGLPVSSWRSLDFFDEDRIFVLREDAPLLVDIDPIDPEEGGLYFPADEAPEGNTAKLAMNITHDLLYVLYMTDQDEEGMTVLESRVFDLRTGVDRTPDVEGLGFALLDVHPEGEVLADLTPELNEIRLLDPISLDTIDTFE